jgi:hypothetical protein
MRCCQGPGFLRKTKGTQHFYHKYNDHTCQWMGESPDHERLKLQIYRICKSERWETQIEYRSKNGVFIADVLARKDDRTVVFEVQLSKISLSDLEKRETEYRNRKIESYWILKNYLDAPEIDYVKEVVKNRPILAKLDFIRDPGLPLKFENYFYICKKICSVGITSPYENVYFTKESALSLNDWVISVLNGDYKNELEQRLFQFNQIAYPLPILEKVAELKVNLEKHKKTISILGHSRYNCNIDMELATACHLNSDLTAIYKRIEYEVVQDSPNKIKIIKSLLTQVPAIEEQFLTSLTPLRWKIIQSQRNVYR